MQGEVIQCLKSHLKFIYPNYDEEPLAAKLVDGFWPGGAEPTSTAKRPSNSLWTEKDTIAITYGDTFSDGKTVPLQLLHNFLNEHLSSVISSVHILPFFPFSSDDGFAVEDYRKVNAMLGTWDDIEKIADDFKLMSDLVLNHASSSCKWFDEFRAGKKPGCDYFVTGNPDEDYSKVVRARPTELLKSVETKDGLKHVWCTFGHDQVDMNFSNPDVLVEFVKILRLYIEKGVRVVRLDAVAFLWKAAGTNCIHLPQTHEIIRLLRTLVNHTSEDVVLLTETNVPNIENLTYFGNQNEAHAIYNFSLPPLIVHALLSGRSEYIKNWAATMPPAPEGCAYINFIACHDGIGMRPSDGLIDEDERVKMIEAIRSFGGLVSNRPGRKGNVRPYELNIALFDALKGTMSGPDQWQAERFICAHTIMLALEGIPAFYIHSLLGTPNDYELCEKRKHNRSINRHVWNYDEIQREVANDASHHSVIFRELKRRISIRTGQSAFHPNAKQYVLQLGENLFGFCRKSVNPKQTIVAIANLTPSKRDLRLSALNIPAGQTWYDLLTNTPFPDRFGVLALSPYQCIWLTNPK